MTHVFHDEIQALLRGEKLQFDYARDGDGWEDLDPEIHDHAASHLLSGRKTAYQFRLKPRTVKIGKFEVEAPVLTATEGQLLWYWDFAKSRPTELRCTTPTWDDWLKEGRFFLSESACEAAHEAVAALLRGEA